MGLFTQAQWICDAPFSELPPRNVFRRQQSKDPLPPHRDELCNHHWLVRGSFELQTVPNDARLLITADDHYRLWINGQFVGIGPAPGFPHHYYCNTWDVSRFLRKGRNVIAVHVYYQGLLNRVWVSADHRQGMIAELKQDDRVLFSSSSTWRGIRSAAWASAGTVGYATHFLERFDCRSYDAHWRNIDFDDSAWPAVHVKQQHDYTFVAQPTPTLKMYEVKPVAIHPLNDGASCWLDFGRELTGTLLARARGPAGAEIELRYGEELLADGRVRHAMRCNCDYREYWILSGRDDELEQVDYKGCRYAEVIVPPGAQVDADSIRIQVRHYPLNEDRF
ncbi:MAG TPA: family 78 glycoside hydrolase catalytic domain, partial [Planctomycetota bacterium]|nr:family 78 glycoside hydrolase catalytic domain [Planctomycetota bacterium]